MPIAERDLLVERLLALEDRIARLEGRRTQSESQGFKLCYVDGGTAWFTTAPLDKQWGDDWNDAPYEHNAGSPYAYHDYMKEHGTQPYELCTILYRGLSTPADLAWSGNSPYSVEQINTGITPWLSENGVHIFAGASIEEFKQKVRAAGGTVYKVDEE